jgi:chromosome segregation ATPase
LQTSLADHLYRSQAFALAYNHTLKLYAEPGETERDFKVRCQQAAREARDAALDALRDKYEAKIARITERLQREERELAEDKAEYQGRMGEEVLSGLSSVAKALGLLGRRSRSLSGLSTAASKRRMSANAKADISESEAQITQLKAELDTLRAELEQEAAALTEQWTSVADQVEQVKVAPRKSDVKVDEVALAWAPAWEITYDDIRGRRRTETAPAYVIAGQE